MLLSDEEEGTDTESHTDDVTGEVLSGAASQPSGGTKGLFHSDANVLQLDLSGGFVGKKCRCALYFMHAESQ